MKKLIVPAAAALGVLLTVGVASADPCVEGAYSTQYTTPYPPQYTTSYPPQYTTPYPPQYTTPYPTYVAPAPYPTSYVVAPPRVVVAPRLPVVVPRPVMWGRWNHNRWGWHGHR